MICKNCQSKRIAVVTGKCDDRCSVTVNDTALEGYVPEDLAIGGGDYITIKFCMNCGQMQNNFPLAISELEKEACDTDIVDFFRNHFVEDTLIGSLSKTEIRYIKQSAEELSVKFGNFISNVFSYTVYGNKFPSALKFLEMYKSGDYYLGAE